MILVGSRITDQSFFAQDDVHENECTDLLCSIPVTVIMSEVMVIMPY